MFAVAGSDEAGLRIAMFLIASYAYTTRVRSFFSSQLQGPKPVDQGAHEADRATSKSQIFTAGSPTNGVNAYFFDGVPIGMGRCFQKPSLLFQ